MGTLLLVISIASCLVVAGVVISGLIPEENETLILTMVLAPVLVCLLCTVLIFVKRKTVANITESGIDVSGPMMDITVPFNEITSMDLRDEMNYGVRTWGYGGIRYAGGTFHNKEFGSYKISVDNKVKKFIVIRHAKGILVFNVDTPEATMMMYEGIRKRARNISG